MTTRLLPAQDPLTASSQAGTCVLELSNTERSGRAEVGRWCRPSLSAPHKG
jgi:hypothetical protein